jgi:DNA-binding transcriptional MerR regulator
MDIAEVRERTGLSAAALHHYEELGLIAPTGRVGLRRQYDGEVIEVLSVIALCQRSGFSLDEVRELMNRRKDSEWKALARAKLDDIEERVRSLEQARDGLRHALECTSRDIMLCEHFRSRLEAVYPIRSTQGSSSAVCSGSRSTVEPGCVRVQA